MRKNIKSILFTLKQQYLNKNSHTHKKHIYIKINDISAVKKLYFYYITHNVFYRSVLTRK